jgi:hypothetical protein
MRDVNAGQKGKGKAKSQGYTGPWMGDFPEVGED